VSELESLKVALASMTSDELSLEDTSAIAAEISAIRLQLKRLAFEQQEIRRRLEQHGLIPS
jgi:flagellin-like hook-associated protein FlgL